MLKEKYFGNPIDKIQLIKKPEENSVCNDGTNNIKLRDVTCRDGQNFTSGTAFHQKNLIPRNQNVLQEHIK